MRYANEILLWLRDQRSWSEMLNSSEGKWERMRERDERNAKRLARIRSKANVFKYPTIGSETLLKKCIDRPSCCRSCFVLFFSVFLGCFFGTFPWHFVCSFGQTLIRCSRLLRETRGSLNLLAVVVDFESIAISIDLHWSKRREACCYTSMAFSADARCFSHNVAYHSEISRVPNNSYPMRIWIEFGRRKEREKKLMTFIAGLARCTTF